MNTEQYAIALAALSARLTVVEAAVKALQNPPAAAVADTRAALLRLLTAFYADHQSNLHDGRGAARPDTNAYAEKIEKLFIKTGDS